VPSRLSKFEVPLWSERAAERSTLEGHRRGVRVEEASGNAWLVQALGAKRRERRGPRRWHSKRAERGSALWSLLDAEFVNCRLVINLTRF
jgi:hypothetical protein